VSPDHLIRPICRDDDAAVAAVIRTVQAEFASGADGAALADVEVAAMSQAYCAPRAAYFVVQRAGEVVGGAGIGALAGGPFEVCELRKMYFLPAARGHGLGALLLRHCMRAARGFGYQICYLETQAGMEAARHLYERVGFRPLRQPPGTTRASGCDHWLALEL
jgi:putative acetyltransferase